jgi:hypothetical protein
MLTLFYLFSGAFAKVGFHVFFFTLPDGGLTTVRGGAFGSPDDNITVL